MESHNLYRGITESTQEQTIQLKSISDLPDELLQVIFSYCSVRDLAISISHVCSRWQHLVNEDPVLWRHLWLLCDGKHGGALDALRVIGQAPMLQCISLRCITLKDAIAVLRSLYRNCHHLNKLEMIYFASHINEMFVDFVLTHFPQLQYLSLDCTGRDRHDKLAQLTSLNTLLLHNCVHLSGYALAEMAKRCKFLSALHIETAIYVTDNDIVNFIDQGGETLVELTINGYRLTDVTFVTISRKCPNLTKLRVQDAKQMTVKGLNGIINLVHLRSLSLIHTPLINQEEFAIPWENIHGNSKLQELQLESTCVDAWAAFSISKSCPYLKKLALTDSPNMTNTGLRHFLNNCSKLKEIYLWCVPQVRSCDLVDISSKIAVHIRNAISSETIKYNSLSF